MQPITYASSLIKRENNTYKFLSYRKSKQGKINIILLILGENYNIIKAFKLTLFWEKNHQVFNTSDLPHWSALTYTATTGRRNTKWCILRAPPHANDMVPHEMIWWTWHSSLGTWLLRANTKPFAQHCFFFYYLNPFQSLLTTLKRVILNLKYILNKYIALLMILIFYIVLWWF